MGEGGTDTSITLLANKVTALAGEEFQTTVGGAQVPTMGIQRPVQPESTVKPVEINIPDFLKNSKR